MRVPSLITPDTELVEAQLRVYDTLPDHCLIRCQATEELPGWARRHYGSVAELRGPLAYAQTIVDIWPHALLVKSQSKSDEKYIQCGVKMTAIIAVYIEILLPGAASDKRVVTFDFWLNGEQT